MLNSEAMPRRSFPLTVLLVLLASCGGKGTSGVEHAGASGQGGSLTDPNGGASAQGGAARGGAAGSGGRAGEAGRAGEGGAGGVAGGCNALPSCRPGEGQLKAGSTCPSDTVCRPVTVCGTTILCASSTLCEAAPPPPQCDSGDTRLDGACPPNVDCYTRELCGNTVNCRRDSGAAGAGGAGDVPCGACDMASCPSNNVWVEHSATCCECRACPLGFVACTRGAALCVRTDPDTDGDGCCACYQP